MNKPLTQSEIDATGLLEGWTVDEDGYLCDADGHLLSRERNKAITRLVRACLANRLEADPQPPVEQSEPKSGVWINGEWREIVVNAWCPGCNWNHSDEGDHNAESCLWDFLKDRNSWYFWLAPPAVIEPEPPKCRTCEGVGLIIGFGACPEGCAKSRELYREKWEVIDAVRKIVTRKGEK